LRTSRAEIAIASLQCGDAFLDAAHVARLRASARARTD
jgi:hypothetical protein